MITKYSPDGIEDARHGEQLRQRLHAVGHVPDLRGELGRLLPPRSPRRTTRTAPPRSSPRSSATASRAPVASSGRRSSPDTADDLFGRWNAEKLGASADGSDDYRNAPNTFGWVVEIDPFAPTVGAAEAHRARPLRARELRARRRSSPASRSSSTWGDDSRNEYIYKFVSDAELGPGRRDGRPRRRRQVPRRRQAVRREVQRRRHRRTGSSSRFGVGKVTAGERGLRVRRPGRRARSCAPRRRRAGRDQDGPAGVGRRQPGERRDLLHADQQHRSAAPDRQARCAPTRASTTIRRAPTATPQKGNPNGHIIRMARGTGRAGGERVHLGHLPVRGARPTPMRERQPLRAHAPTTTSRARTAAGSAAPRPASVDPDRRRRLHRRDQLHDAGRAARHGGRRREEDHHERGRRDDGQDRAAWVGKRAVATRRSGASSSGPKECEITGVAETPDGKTLFVNIQHPGEETVARLREPRDVRQPLAGRRQRAPAFGDDRDHPQRRRQDRPEVMLGVCSRRCERASSRHSASASGQSCREGVFSRCRSPA